MKFIGARIVNGTFGIQDSVSGSADMTQESKQSKPPSVELEQIFGLPVEQDFTADLLLRAREEILNGTGKAPPDLHEKDRYYRETA